jgi:hypothetical protein
MTALYGQASPFVGDHSQVGVQGQHITVTGGVHVGGPGESPEAKYAAGVANLDRRNPERARELIWEAMTGWEARGDEYVTSEVLFYWLVAMLSGRTVRQFSGKEIGQLRHFRSRYAESGGDEWAAGVRLIYQLLDSVLRPPGTRPGPDTDVSLLEKQFDDLGEAQRKLLLRLELFLSGPRKDEIWQGKLQDARSRQRSGDRLDRAWKFFHPDPVEVNLPEPRPVAAGTRWMRFSALVFAVIAGSFGLDLLWKDAALGLLGYVVALGGGITVAAADLELRFYRERSRRLRGEQPWVLGQGKMASNDEFAQPIEKLLQRYVDRYGPDEITRGLWKNAPGGVRQFYRNEITGICRSTGASIAEVDWFIRYEVRQMLQRAQGGALRLPREQPREHPAAPAACRTGWIVLALGCALAVFALRVYALGTAVVLLGEYWAWACWLPVALERRRHAADEREHDHRQAGIEEAFRKWSERLEDRPSDAEMAEWLERDRTVLLGRALDYFRLPRSRLVAHGFLEKPGVGARRMQLDGCLARYQGYQTWMFLLAEDGVRQMRASLDFLTGTLVEREEITYGYSSIAAVHVTRKRGGQTFELRLTGGDPITVQVKKPAPGAKPPDNRGDQDENAELAEEAEEAGDAANDDDLDVASITNTLHLLEGVAAEGRKWLQEHSWATAWTGDKKSDSAGGFPPQQSETGELRHAFSEMETRTCVTPPDSVSRRGHG